MKTLEMMRAEIAATPLEGKPEALFIIFREALLALKGGKEAVEEFYAVAQSAVAASQSLGDNPAAREACALQIISHVFSEIAMRVVAVELAAAGGIRNVMLAASYLSMIQDLQKIGR